MTSRTWCHALALCGALTMSSCGSGEPRGGPRVPTFSVKGEVYVDGKPAAGVVARAFPVANDSNDPSATNFTAMSGPNGELEFGTYISKDGLPAGEYAITFTWPVINLMKRGKSPGQDDKLNGRYDTIDTAPAKVTVVKDKASDLGRIELKSEE